jgi:DNA-binding GntR family transcriptional regulator
LGDLARPSEKSQAALIYHQCRRAILNWDWPPGARLKIKELSQRFESRQEVIKAIYHLEAEGYLSQTSRGRYVITGVDELEITNHYRSIDFGYGEALRAMIGFMKDGTIDPKIVELLEEVLQSALVSKVQGDLTLDDIFTAKYYYILILAAARNFELMNYVLSVDKLRYSRWIAESIDESTQDDLFRLNIQLQRNIAEQSVGGATALMTYIFQEYRRLINIYISSQPIATGREKLDYTLVGEENPSGYPCSPFIDSQNIAEFVARVRERVGDAWPHVFVDRYV